MSIAVRQKQQIACWRMSSGSGTAEAMGSGIDFKRAPGMRSYTAHTPLIHRSYKKSVGGPVGLAGWLAGWLVLG